MNNTEKYLNHKDYGIVKESIIESFEDIYIDKIK